MKLDLKIAGPIAAVVIAAFSAQASATIVNIVATGTITDSRDDLGVFNAGAPATTNQYDGMTFTAAFTVDTALGQPASIAYGSNATGWVGGSVYSSPAFMSATATINGVTTSAIFGTYVGEYFRYLNSSPFSQFTADLTRTDPEGSTGLTFTAGNFDNSLASIPLTGPYSLTPTGPYRILTFFENTGDAVTSISADLSLVTVSSAVPEPSTWALMILGFFFVASFGYRRRDKALNAA